MATAETIEQALVDLAHAFDVRYGRISVAIEDYRIVLIMPERRIRPLDLAGVLNRRISPPKGGSVSV